MEDCGEAKAAVEEKNATVTETGDSAEAIAMAGGKGSRESSTFKLTRINGEWKLAKP